MVSFGDRSADRVLSKVLKPLKEKGIEIFGIVGEETEGLIDPVGRLEDLEATGFVEVIPKIPKIALLERRLLKEVSKRKPKVALLVDAPGFNLRLIKKLKKLGVERIVYFILPQFWAWKKERKKVLETYADTLISILPFEEKFFKNSPVEFLYVGHPSVELLETVGTQKITKQSYFVIFPGSRPNEIKRHLPVLKEAIPKAVEEFNLLPIILTFPEYEKRFTELKPFSKIVNLGKNPLEGLSIIKGAEFGWIKSGTTAFESSILGTPHLTFYKVNPISFWLAKRLVEVDRVHLANIILDELVVPELLQGDFTAKNLLKATYQILEKRDLMREKFNALREMLTTDVKPTRKVSEALLKYLL
jgi:lipid-A-disaccharide synthase